MATTSGAVLTGHAGSPGVGIGRSLLVPTDRPASSESVPGQVRSGGDPDEEAVRLRTALDAASTELTALAAATAAAAGEEVGAIFEAQALFAADPGIVEPALEAVAGGASAVDAILDVTERQAQGLAEVDDPYFRERAADVRDVGRRIAGLLRGEPRPDLWHADGQPAVLVAEDLDPSAVAALRRELVAGIVLGGGAPTSHAAIVARALGIPLVLGLGADLPAIPAGVEIAVDGGTGRVLVAPAAAVVDALRQAAESVPAARGPAALQDVGRPHGIAIVANVASALEVEAATTAGAHGVGLVRTELLFLGRHTPPSTAEQRATYAAILAAAGDRPVTFRTLDIGGDKPAAWQIGPAEANPALGVRGVRLARRQPGLLDDQLRALVEAAGHRPLRVMIPMVSTADELALVRARLDAIVAEVEEASGATPSSLELGAMIEVPSAAIMADAIAAAAAFLSIGTNDLVQYTLAADRTNPELAELASPLQPAVLRLINGVVRAADRYGRDVAVCGEAAADAAVVPILVGLGVTELSVAPSSVARVHDLVAALDPAACRTLAARALEARTLAEVRALVA
jgi:phosphocarrier protein FPr